jgi:hypothetical protein
MNATIASHRRMSFAVCTILLAALSMLPFIGTAQEPATQTKPKSAPTAAPPIEEFEKYLTNAVLTGVFTIDGQPLNKLEEERYEIKTCKKVEGEESLWELQTRIKYGDKDLTVPVFVNIEWVGRTPMIVLDSITIPGLGTFSARVVFHDRKYAGTWKHDNVGGHLFGRVEPAESK